METQNTKKNSKNSTANPKKKINLALQGGGSHGAFTWGVLDRLLEDGRIEIEGISGTSAGAMNASVTAYGLAIGGAEGARQKLKEFWNLTSQAGQKGPLRPSQLDKMLSVGNMDYSPNYLFFDFLAKVMSPYELNPLNVNPLRDVLAQTVDFDKLRDSDSCKLFIAATNVGNGHLRVFENKEVSLDAVLASACLPFLFQAVEIEGEHYWDGGYIGNPPLFPLITQTESPDILIIQINPVNIKQMPKNSREILDRINTLSFNSSLMRELRAVHFVTNLIDNGELSQDKHKRVFIHTIEAESIVEGLGVSSKLNTDAEYLKYLFEGGRKLASQFLEEHFDKIGNQSSTDLATKFM